MSARYKKKLLNPNLDKAWARRSWRKDQKLEATQEILEGLRSSEFHIRMEAAQDRHDLETLKAHHEEALETSKYLYRPLKFI